MNEINIILDGKIVKGTQGESILNVAQREGVKIPTLCHDPRLEPFTSCYLCVVQVEGMRGLQPSCSTKIAEGMNVVTQNNKITKARKTALDLLLSNHYADCVAPCKETCPAGVDVQGYISFIEKGMYHEAIELIKETNPLPAICGRVCVRPCEVACRRNLLDEGYGVGIDYLKRFAADRDLESANKWRPEIKRPTGKKVCVIGAGPGGLSAAFFLRKEGHEVDIYEASPAAGGWLRYGIPEYRLPNDLLQKEVDNITELGVQIFYRKELGKNVFFKDLKSKYDAFILAVGSQLGTLIGCEGEDAINVFSGVDFLKEMEVTGKRFDFSGKTVAVIGGGNTAMDCCRSAMRCGAAKTYIIYRRTEHEMPANPIEIHESKLEGVEYMVLTNPSRVNKDGEGKVKSITCLKMELGEPDASGRRRPVPVQGSEFDVPVDYILAAIGQKTKVEFLEDLNGAVDQGELKITRWGDIEADPATLQTGVPGMFAAGDSVTGPATLIQAISQAKIATRSCHQYLTGETLAPKPFEFISRKDHFKVQETKDYTGSFGHQQREEMPTLDPVKRNNFSEVELGYASAGIAFHETQRCLECGCTEYYTCDLKRYATEYKVDQKRLGGDYKEYAIDFRHPYVEIDNNKCILCSRCVRICREVVGANALGLVNRGFETYIAPSMGLPLLETSCESCGMCISTCPTAAITENFFFKPGPVKLTAGETICPYCSVGCRITLNHKNGFVMKVTGAEGTVNTTGNLCRFPKFGYSFYNDNQRITKPQLKVNGRFEEISFEKAYEIIKDKIKQAGPDESAFFAGARLTNEEMYLVQKLARVGAGTNQVGSFHYAGRGRAYATNTDFNVPFSQIDQASKLYLLGSEINRDNAVAGFMVNEARILHHIPVALITEMPDSPMKNKVDEVLEVDCYYSFVKAVNHFLLSEGLQNQLYINDQCEGYNDYKTSLLGESYEKLVNDSGLSQSHIEAFAREYNEQMNAIILFSEKELDANTCMEVFNLAMITGKLGKTANGLISLKEKNNAQGIFDMGLVHCLGVGGQHINNEDLQRKMKEAWKVDSLPKQLNPGLISVLGEKKIKNLMVFGEDPLGCTTDRPKVAAWFESADFVVVQDAFMTESARAADLIMPASFAAETGGSFTNTQKVYQEFQAILPSRLEKSSLQQLLDLDNMFTGSKLRTKEEVMAEAFSLLPAEKQERRVFVATACSDESRLFLHGCDSLQKRFAEDFSKATGKEF